MSEQQQRAVRGAAGGAADGTLTYTPAANANGVGDRDGDAAGRRRHGQRRGGHERCADVHDHGDGGERCAVVHEGREPDGARGRGGADGPAWATADHAGPADESGQTLDFIVTNDNNALFSMQPAIDGNGTLTYTPAANANGSATVTVRLQDNGGTANGGVDTSAAQTFTITVTPVNDAPSFTKGADQTVLEDAGAQTVAGWATAISAGPANESAQTLTFTVSNDNNGVVRVAAGDRGHGTLTYTPAANANGVATVTVTIRDDGGTANGGVDTSARRRRSRSR